MAKQDWLEGGMGHKNQEEPTKSYSFQIQVNNMRKLTTKTCFAFLFSNQARLFLSVKFKEYLIVLIVQTIIINLFYLNNMC